ncbi:hypothetical protein FIBSPDRAFT_1036007 [Athelia psychrophila]|uniref:GSKIP domain-containing protein n=1 Tax=Athelia psychrophila TaxID=1759441 RepID=A0A166W6H5_9AGAM|nr:hypothetical protein FIBSPDRAFT_1036007 [Fibularhizoctonia sp. CBS 109695]
MSSFFTAELDRSLREQSFGIAGFEPMRPSGSLEASAHVTLLEGEAITISLTSRGYQLVKNQRTQAGKVYEAIEALLQSVSGAYECKRRDTLFAKLEKLSYA